MAVTNATRLAAAEAQLTAVQAAILKAVKAQSHTIGDQSIVRQQLRELRAMESALESKIIALQQAANTDGYSGGTSQATFQ